MILDIGVLIIIVYSFYKGIKEGLFISIASFLSFIIGVIAALKFSNVIKNYLHLKLTWDPYVLSIVSFVITFAIAVFLLHLVAKVFTKLFHAMYLGLLNRLAGGLFQVLKVLIISCLALAVFEKVNLNQVLLTTQDLETSKFYGFYTTRVKHVVPDLFHLIDTLFDTSLDQKMTQDDSPII